LIHNQKLEEQIWKMKHSELKQTALKNKKA